MPVGALGQKITFAVNQEAGEHYSQYRWVHVRVGDTVAKIVARYGHPEMAKEVAKLNGIRDPFRQLRWSNRNFHSGGTGLPFPKVKNLHKIRLPGTLVNLDVVSILADTPPPLIKDGYAQYDVIDVPGRKGISRFKGFNPVAIDVPVQWNQWTVKHDDGQTVEDEIERLERMAGRRPWHGPIVSTPAVVRVSVTDHNGRVVPLIPRGYQWMHNSMGIAYRISNITWDPNPMRIGLGHFGRGNRLVQKAVVELTEYSQFEVAERSASHRSRSRNGH